MKRITGWVLIAFVAALWRFQPTGFPPAPAPTTKLPPQPTPQPMRAASSLPPGAQNLAERVGTTEARRENLLRLMAENPAEAWAQSISWSEWAALPEELRALTERPFSERVDFEVLPHCPPLEGATAGIPGQAPTRRIRLDGQWREAFVFGSKLAITSKEGLPVRGFELGGKVLLAESSFEHLAGEDLTAARALFPDGSPRGISWTSRTAVGAEGRTILLAGALHELASAAEEAELGEVLAAAEKSLHPQAVAMALSAGTAAAGTVAFDLDAARKPGRTSDSTWTETAKKTLALRISYADGTAASYTEAALRQLVVNSSNAVKVMSYGKTWLVPTVVSVTLPKTHAEYQDGGPDLIVNDARAALTARGINRDTYDIVIHAHPGHGFAYAGLGVIGGANNWLNGNVSLEVLTHEIGHNYGLGHAHYQSMSTGMGSIGHAQATDGALVEKEEYGDPFDIMGGSSLPAGHYNAHGKAYLNWIETKEVINVTTNGIYRVYRFDHKDARTNANAKLALKVTAPGGEEYWVAHRKLFTTSTPLSKGANITRADGPGDQSLVDTTPLSKPSQGYGADRDDAALAVGKSFQDSVNTVRVTTIASGGTAPLEYLDVQVAFLDTGAFSFYTASDLSTNGLVGSYINSNLRSRTAQSDWRATAGITVAGRRVDARLSFTSDGWGARAPLRLTGGTDANWESFSVQWDGYIVVRKPVRLATVSDDSSRFWIDLNGNNSFGSTAPEYVNNHWGNGQGPTRGDLSAVIPPGTYRFRIQYEEGNGGNYFTMSGTELPFQLFTTADATTPGLTGSYVDKSLRGITAQTDWRESQAIAGTRVDAYPGFIANGWGTLADVGLSTGTDGDWNAFSVQWDGFLSNSVPLKMATVSDDYSRMWIDLNTNGAFGIGTPELINNGWGSNAGQGFTMGVVSAVIPPGLYALRVQYEEGGGGNQFLLVGTPQPAPDPVTLSGLLVFTGDPGNPITPLRSIAGDFTIEFWMKTAPFTGTQGDWIEGLGLVDASFPGSANDFGLTLAGGKILFSVGGANPATLQSDDVADEKWHHVAARRVQSTGAISLFVDGVECDRGVGGTELLDAATNLTLGMRSDLSHRFIGAIDAVKIAPTPRTLDQILTAYHTTRTPHGFTDSAPLVHITRRQTNSVQIYWDALSSYRVLEGATALDGAFTPLPTDQNSTNIIFGATPMRYFRTRK